MLVGPGAGWRGPQCWWPWVQGARVRSDRAHKAIYLPYFQIFGRFSELKTRKMLYLLKSCPIEAENREIVSF